MRAVVQRVTRAQVSVNNLATGRIGPGLLLLVGVGAEDSLEFVRSRPWKVMLDKIVNLRIFTDEAGKFNHSLVDVGGDVLLVSQFTLYADCRKGRRPSFSNAAPPEVAKDLFDLFVEDMRTLAPAGVATGVFGAGMLLDFVNWGPVTITLDSADFG